MAPKITIPTSPSELEDMLNDPGVLKNVLSDAETRTEFFKAYGIAAMEKDGSLKAQIGEQVQSGIAEFMKANGSGSAPPVQLSRAVGDRQLSDSMKVSRGRGAAYNKRAAGARADGIFGDGPEFFQAVSRHVHFQNQAELTAKLAKLEEIQNSYGSMVPADGGFLIPEEFRADIMMVALEEAQVRPRATVIPMGSLRLSIPAVDSTSNQTSVFGGVTTYWGEESAPLTESQASFGKVQLDAKKLTAFSNVPNELLQDAPAFAAFFDMTFPQAMAFQEDATFFTGTGVGEPFGFIGCPATVSVAKETGQAPATIVWENITKMFSRMLPSALMRAVWVCGIDSFPEIATMALAVGTGGGPVWIGGQNSPGANSPPVSILGRPVVFTEKASVLGTAGDISFTDLSYYLIGDRQQIQLASSPHYRFANDQTSFRAISRVDGRPWLQSSITPQNGGPALSAFVNIATRS